MKPVRIHDFKVGRMYRWALGDPDELFVVLSIPGYLDPIYPNKVSVLSSKFTKRTMQVFHSDKFFEVNDETR
jgi:hypothetical protein